MNLTARATEKWGQQHRSMPDWTGHYWRSREKPARQEVLTALKAFHPFETLVELGCNVGPMLALIHDEYPQATLSGVETNALAVEECAGNVPSATVHLADLMQWLPSSQGRTYDVVLTYYTLAYIAPEDLPAVLWQMKRLAKKGLVLAEPIATSDVPAGLVYHYPEWRHDYHTACDGLDLTLLDTHLLTTPDGYLNGVITFSV